MDASPSVPTKSHSAKPKKAAKQRWPYIRLRKYPNGATGWSVDARTANGGERRTFQTQAEAETFASHCRIQRSNEGVSSFGNAELAIYGKTIADAVRFYLEHLRRQKNSVSVSTAIAEMVKAKSAGWSKRYKRDLMYRLRRFEQEFGEQQIAGILADDIIAWLDRMALVPETRNTVRNRISCLFGYAGQRKWRTDNPFSGDGGGEIPVVKAPNKIPSIFTPAQAAKLMEVVSEETLPYWSIALFAGLRPESEIERLHWDDVDLDEKVIAVHSEGKTGRRVVKMHENLIEWLRPHAKKTGMIISASSRSTLHRKLAADTRRAGYGTPGTETEQERAAGVKLTPWVQDITRHSFISYLLAECGDIGVVSTQAGNSPQKVQKNYLQLVKPKDAVRFWKIMPSADTKKVIAFAAR